MSSSTTRPARNKDNIAKLLLPFHMTFVEAAQASPAPPSKSPLPERPSSTRNSADVAWTHSGMVGLLPYLTKSSQLRLIC
jgi:hypothetical protein